jgi:hypothetical protein
LLRVTTRRLALLSIACLSASGCIRIQRNTQPPGPKEGVYSEPTGDGSHYIEVVGEPTVPPLAVRGKWKREATRVCEGDYLVLSENASERTRGPFVEGRVHEGFVRCISPEVAADEASEQKPKRTPPARGLLPRLSS